MTRLVTAVALTLALAASADAQFVTYYSPVIPAPAPVMVAPAPVAYSVARPITYPVAPAAYTVASPVVPAPVVAAPAPVAYSVARPVVATTTIAPTPVVTTRYRLFRGPVTRVRYQYRPVTYYSY